MLDKFHKAKQQEIDELHKLAENNNFPKPLMGNRVNFIHALHRSPFAIIAEYKRASPSRGVIRQDLDIENVAWQYAQNGASALSILTEEIYFNGKLEYLNKASQISGLPILRKDFICDPLQIKATAATRASAILLIVRFINNEHKLKELIREADKYGLACVVEIFDENDLKIARTCGANIIQVNARDLQTLKTDRNLCLNLIKKFPPMRDETWIAASGLEAGEHLLEAQKTGYNACLIGTALMKKGNPGENLANLKQDMKNACKDLRSYAPD